MATAAQPAQYQGTGKRKTSVARVILRPGDGATWVNGKTIETYFPRLTHRELALAPLKVAGVAGTLDVRVRVPGGGPSGPAGAVGLDAILAISRWVAVPATLVVGVTGVFQLADGPYSLEDAWLAAGLALYLAVMAVAVLYLAPAYRRAGEAARAGSIDDYRAAVGGTKLVGPLVAAAVLATAVLMEVKPG